MKKNLLFISVLIGGVVGLVNAEEWGYGAPKGMLRTTAVTSTQSVTGAGTLYEIHCSTGNSTFVVPIDTNSPNGLSVTFANLPRTQWIDSQIVLISTYSSINQTLGVNGNVRTYGNRGVYFNNGLYMFIQTAGDQCTAYWSKGE